MNAKINYAKIGSTSVTSRTGKSKPIAKTPLRLPASKAFLWAHCGGSVKLKNAGDPFAPFDAARKGILTHGIAAAMLLGKGPSVLTAWEKQLHAANLTEINDAVAFYLNLIQNDFAEFKTLYPDATMHVEETLRIEKNGYVFEGPPDVYFLSKKFQIVHVYDLKSGWVEVEADGNEQLILYCHSIAYLNGFKSPTLKGIIAQPLLNQEDAKVYFYDENFFDSIEVDTGHFKVGAHCKKCHALTACAKAKKAIEFFNNPEFADDTAKREKYFPELLQIASVGEEFFKRIQKEAKSILELGGTIDGWALGKGKAGKRVWAESVSKKTLAEVTGIDVGMLVEEKLLSPKGVDDLLKGKKEIKDSLKSLYYQPVYPTLVFTGAGEAFMDVKKKEKPTKAEKKPKVLPKPKAAKKDKKK